MRDASLEIATITTALLNTAGIQVIGSVFDRRAPSLPAFVPAVAEDGAELASGEPLLAELVFTAASGDGDFRAILEFGAADNEALTTNFECIAAFPLFDQNLDREVGERIYMRFPPVTKHLSQRYYGFRFNRLYVTTPPTDWTATLRVVHAPHMQAGEFYTAHPTRMKVSN